MWRRPPSCWAPTMRRCASGHGGRWRSWPTCPASSPTPRTSRPSRCGIACWASPGRSRSPGPRRPAALSVLPTARGRCYSRAPWPRLRPRRSPCAPPTRGARKADPRPITGKETPRRAARPRLRRLRGPPGAHRVRADAQSMEQDASIFLTLSGAMTPAGLHQSCLIPLIERGVISALTTTGANLYHDAHRIIGHAHPRGEPQRRRPAATGSRASSASTTWASGRRRCSTPTGSSARIIRRPEFQRKMTTPEFHYLLGKAHRTASRRRSGVEAALAALHLLPHGVPIFVGAVQDGSIFLNVVKLQAAARRRRSSSRSTSTTTSSRWRRCSTTAGTTLEEAGDLDPRRRRAQELHAPGRAAARPDPRRAHHGFDIDVQFCVDPVDNGALSSCPAGEGHTWGKVSVEAVETGSVYVHTRRDGGLPLAHPRAALRAEERSASRMRLMDRLDEAVAFLDADVQKRRKELMKTLDWSIEDAEPTRTRTRSSTTPTSAEHPRARSTP